MLSTESIVDFAFLRKAHFVSRSYKVWSCMENVYDETVHVIHWCFTNSLTITNMSSQNPQLPTDKDSLSVTKENKKIP